MVYGVFNCGLSMASQVLFLQDSLTINLFCNSGH